VKIRNVITAFALAAALPLTACQSGMVKAANIEDLVERMALRQEAILTGQLDPATISEEDKKTFRRSGHLLRVVVATALKKEPPAIPADLAPPVTTPPGQ